MKQDLLDNFTLLLGLLFFRMWKFIVGEGSLVLIPNHIISS